MRSKSALLNVLTGWLGQLLIVAANLLSRKVFLNSLGELYLGLNGLLTNVVTFLSMAELGIGTAITFSLYKPIADHDIPAIKSLMLFFKKVYWSFGSIIFVMGLAVSPFLPLIVGKEKEVEGLFPIFLFFVLNTSVSYFFSYKSTFLIADQKGYIFNINHYIWQCLMYCSQIAILLIWKNYYLYLTVQLLTTILSNVVIVRICDKLYPFLKEKDVDPIGPETKKEIYKNTGSLILNRVGNTMVNSTDNILISMLVSVESVARYNNYTTVISAAAGFLQKGIMASVSSVANFNVQESNQKKLEVFEMYSMLCTWLFGWLTISAFFLVPPFVQFFYGETYMLNKFTLGLMCINSFLDSQIILFSIFISAMGLYWHTRYVGIIQALINLVISIIAGKLMGIGGIIIGTFLSKMCYSFWKESHVVLNTGLNAGRRKYLLSLLCDTIILLLIAAIIYFISTYLSNNVYIYFLELLVICTIIPNLCMYLIKRKTKSFQRIKTILLNVVIRKIRNRLKPNPD